jgi:uracil-DNA glycosylase family 4
MLLKGPLPRPEECVRCPLAKDGQPVRPVPGSGTDAPLLVIIGEGPGATEVMRGEPFVGPSGHLLNRVLGHCGVERRHTYVTNATLCLPPKSDDTKKWQIVNEAAACCRPRLERELAQIQGDTNGDGQEVLPPIVLVGKQAALTVLGKTYKTDMMGSYHYVSIGERSFECIPSIHPAAILHGADQGKSSDHQVYQLLFDLGKAASLARGEEELFTQDVEIESTHVDRALALLQRFKQHVEALLAAGGPVYVACDTETRDDGVRLKQSRGANAYHAALTAIGFATTEWGLSVNWDICGDTAQDIVAWVLAHEGVVKVFHNAVYDIPVLEKHGFPVNGRVEDTMFAHHNAFPGIPHKLQRVATQFMLVPPWKTEFREGTGETVDLLLYNSLDTLSTARIVKPILFFVKKNKAERTYDMDKKMCEVAMRMHQVGVPLDRERNAELLAYFTPIMERAYKELEERLFSSDRVRERFFDSVAAEQALVKRKDDPESFMERHALRMDTLRSKFKGLNLNTRAHVVGLLEAMGVRLFERTEKGNKSTRQEVLKGMGAHPVIQALLRYREIDKQVGTFVKPMPLYVALDGRVHVVWSPNAISGRWTSQPNYQNWSRGKPNWKKDEKGKPTEKQIWENWLAKPPEQRGLPNLRWQVVAPPGYVFVGADFSALEARVAALLSGDPFLCAAFNDGHDIHTIFSREVFPEFDTWDDVKRKAVRDNVKNAEYSYIYGGSIDTTMDTLIKKGHNVHRSVIERMYATFNEKMWRIPQYYSELHAQVLRTKEIRSFLLGRRVEFPLGNIDENLMRNFPNQSGAADIANTALWEFYQKKSSDCEVSLQVHDAFYALCREDTAERNLELMLATMDQEHTVNGVTVRFKGEGKIAQSWGDMG